MAQKKSFKTALNNPAMQFISVPEEVEEVLVQEMLPKAVAETPAQKGATKKQANTQSAAEEQTSREKEQPRPIKKQNTQNAVPEGYKINPMYIEVKSKRVQLVLQPSLFEKVKALAEKKQDSVNNTIHAILEAATKDE